MGWLTSKRPVAGSQGDSQNIPVIGFDQNGRITSLSTTPIDPTISTLGSGRSLSFFETPGATVGPLFVGMASGTSRSNNGTTGFTPDADGTPWGVWTTATTVNTNAGNSATGFGDAQMNTSVDCNWFIKTGPAASDIANCRIWVAQFVANLAGGTRNVNNLPSVVGFLFDPSTNSDWRCVTGTDAGPTNTNTSSGVVVAVDTAYHFRAVMKVTSVDFYINGTLITNTATNLPGATTALASQFIIWNTSAGTARTIKFRQYFQVAPK